MVLQQQSTVKLWGSASKNKLIYVSPSWSNKIFSVKSDESGRWLVSIKTPKAGGPYSISFNDGKELKISNVLIGEVWLCSGQSNMEMPVKGYPGQPINDAQNTIVQADPLIPIRMFKLEKQKSITPIDSCKGKWGENTPQSVKEFSATGYFFAKHLQSVLKVPVGVICAAWGGANIESYMDSLTLSFFSKVNTPKKNTLIDKHPVNCELYNGMIYPLRQITIKGVLWYQGEANAHASSLYKKEFPAMVSQWRKLWGQGEFPFYYAQIAAWRYSKIDSVESAMQREVQTNAQKVIPNSGMIVTYDTGDPNIIHPKMKKEAGERFAYWALAKTYGREGIEYRSPQYKSMSISNDTISIQLDFAEDGLNSSSAESRGFEIAGSDRKFKPAKVVLRNKGRELLLTEPTIKNPVAVRYGFKNYMPVSMYSNLGFPLCPFRTDDW